jgi:hypothetical protein
MICSIAYGNVDLNLLAQDKYLRVGKITKITFTTKDENFLKQIRENNKGTSLGEFLYLYSVEFIQDEDKNNILIGASVVLKKLPPTSSINLIVDKKNYLCNLINVEFHPDDANIQAQSSIYQEKYTLKKVLIWFKNNLHYLILLTFFVVSALSLLIFKYVQRKKIQQADDNKKREWKETIQKAKTRKELEYIYQQRNKWKKYYSSKEAENFLNYLNTIQYSPEWSEEELSTLLDKLDAFRRTIP